MGKYDFSSWTLHTASIIIFATLWGLFPREWRGTSIRTKLIVCVGLFLLIASTIVVGFGDYLKASQDATENLGDTSTGLGSTIDVAAFPHTLGGLTARIRCLSDTSREDKVAHVDHRSELFKIETISSTSRVDIMLGA